MKLDNLVIASIEHSYISSLVRVTFLLGHTVETVVRQTDKVSSKWKSQANNHGWLGLGAVLSGMRRGLLSLKMSITLLISSFFVISLSDDRRHKSDIFSSVNLFLCGVFTRFIVEKLLSASADETGKLLFKWKSFIKFG